jgi:flagellin
MPLSIISNVASLRAQRQLTSASSELERTFQRLASGKRINTASDDAAGLAISASLRRDTRLATTAIRNANDGISLISITDGALGEIGSVLGRLAELAEQSANGTLSTRQRSAMQNEFQALGEEIERISSTTSFNGLNILSGGANIILQVGFNSQSTSQLTITGVESTLGSIRLANAGSSSLIYSINGATNLEAQQASRTALDAVYAAINEVSARRGSLGAAESKLSTTISNLSSARQNFEAAASRIEDADVAVEAAAALRLKIVQDAAAAILAQANQQPALALRLLQTTSNG